MTRNNAIDDGYMRPLGAAPQPRARLRFPLGRIVATPGALEALDIPAAGAQHLKHVIGRHALGDWGEVCPEDAKANDDALHYGSRVLSAYTVNATKIWVITEADRSTTTILLPEEY